MPETPELKQRVEPLIGGIQIQSRKKRGIGTLGCIVFDKRTGKPMGLTNRHILKKRKGFSVVQPSGKPRTKEFVIGNISRKGRNRRGSNDYAVFELDLEHRDYDKENSIFGLKGKITEHVEPEKGMKVQKVGQYTGHTYGIVERAEAGSVVIKPNYEKMPKDPQELSDELSAGGDSGALWVTDEPNFKAVALHWAGEKYSRRRRIQDVAYAVPISKVLNSLGVRF